MKDSFHRTEGDINLSDSRRAWYAVISDTATQHYLDADAKYFLHQSMSTPCLDVLQSCEGIYITDLTGKRYMDFHGKKADGFFAVYPPPLYQYTGNSAG